MRPFVVLAVALTSPATLSAGELLSQAEGLLRIGVHASEVVEGYRKASTAALRMLEELSCRCVHCP